MRVLKAIGAAILATASILGGIGSFAQWAGIEFTGVVGVVVGAAHAWLPIASLLFGILIGWNAKKWQESKRLKARDEEVSELQNQVAELEKRPRQEQLDDALAEKEIEQREPLETAFAVVCSTCLVDARGGLVDPLLFDTENRHLGIIGLDRNSVKELEDLGLIRKRENLAPNRDVIKAEDLNSPLIHIADGVEIESDTVIYRFKSGDETFNRNRQQWKPAGKWGGICHVVDLGIYEFTSRGRRKAESMDTPTAANIRAYVSTCLTDSHIEEDREQD